MAAGQGPGLARPPQYKTCVRPDLGPYVGAEFGADGTLFLTSAADDAGGQQIVNDLYVARSEDLGDSWDFAIAHKGRRIRSRGLHWPGLDHHRGDVQPVRDRPTEVREGGRRFQLWAGRSSECGAAESRSSGSAFLEWWSLRSSRSARTRGHRLSGSLTSSQPARRAGRPVTSGAGFRDRYVGRADRG